MAKYTKPDVSIQWAQTGTIVAPSDAKKQVGWIEEKPAFEYMNWLQNRQDKALAYSFQMGIPEWDNTTEYQSDTTYASYVQYNGIVYKSILTGSNKNPATETSYWQRAFDNYGAASTVNTALTTHITNYGTLASLSNVATARSNLSVYSKAETDAAYAPYAGNSSQTFLVATATSAGHAVRKSQFDAKTGQADESTAGIMEVATQAETNAGASDVVAVTPLKLATNLTAKTASVADTKTGSSSTLFTTPASIKGLFNDTGQQSLSSNGYQKLPGGLILQWGKTGSITANGTLSITFPISFPAACVSCTTTKDNADVNQEFPVDISSLNASGFTAVNTGSASMAAYWFAVGY